MNSLSFLHAHLRMHTFVVIHKWKIDLLIVKNEGTVNSVYLLQPFIFGAEWNKQ